MSSFGRGYSQVSLRFRELVLKAIWNTCHSALDQLYCLFEGGGIDSRELDVILN